MQVAVQKVRDAPRGAPGGISPGGGVRGGQGGGDRAARSGKSEAMTHQKETATERWYSKRLLFFAGI